MEQDWSLEKEWELWEAARLDKAEKIRLDAEYRAMEEYWEARPEDPDNPFR